MLNEILFILFLLVLILSFDLMLVTRFFLNTKWNTYELYSSHFCYQVEIALKWARKMNKKEKQFWRCICSNMHCYAKHLPVKKFSLKTWINNNQVEREKPVLNTLKSTREIKKNAENKYLNTKSVWKLKIEVACLLLQRISATTLSLSLFLLQWLSFFYSLKNKEAF